MCGIHLTLATQPLHSLQDHHGTNDSSCRRLSKDDVREGQLSVVDSPEWLTRRGVDGTGRVEWVQTYAMDGSNGSHEKESSDVSMTCRVTLQASVLSMRQAWMAQPVAMPLSSDETDETSAHVAWNGEIYQMLVPDVTHVQHDTVSEQDASNLVLRDVCHSDVADTTLVAERVQQVLQTMAVLHSDTMVYDPARNLERMQTTARHLTTQLWNRLSDAEYAFCILTEHAVYYGRDMLGRRSLLETSTLTNDREGDVWFLSSVATLEDPNLSPGGAPVWTEVEPGIVHGYDWKSRRRVQERICVPSISSTRMSPDISTKEVPEAGVHAASLELRRVLQEAVRRRCHVPQLNDDTASPVAVLFSGGLDSTVVAALVVECGVTNVTLLTVSFVDATTGRAGNSTTAADATAAVQSHLELQARYPHATIRLVHRVVDWEQVTHEESRIRQLIHPKTTVMDLNIATALWFAASALSPTNDSEQSSPSGRVLLSGLGADELLGGYGRHRSAWERGGNVALRHELDLDLDRLWERNLGRDDRVLSDTSHEVRFPFLDATVRDYIQQLPLDAIVDFASPPGMGDKYILRLVARALGLSTAAGAVKRAIQFGSRIAHVSDKRRFGSRRKATGERET